MDFFLQLLFAGIGIGAVYALVALGFVLIFRATSVVNFAQGEFSMVAAYLMVVFAVDLGWPYWLAFLISIAGMALLGAVFNLFVYYPLRNRTYLPVLISTRSRPRRARGNHQDRWLCRQYPDAGRDLCDRGFWSVDYSGALWSDQSCAGRVLRTRRLLRRSWDGRLSAALLALSPRGHGACLRGGRGSRSFDVAPGRSLPRDGHDL